MSKIFNHPVLDLPATEKLTFHYNDKKVAAESGFREYKFLKSVLSDLKSVRISFSGVVCLFL